MEEVSDVMRSNGCPVTQVLLCLFLCHYLPSQELPPENQFVISVLFSRTCALPAEIPV